ncbi:M15 family metallopeptidase [Thermotalea metallivorans]|uniref:Peptidase M15C domain-containing protein n=1 Tax=Thermotalea metallivorans TaxID=520762 RepID=A0A140LA94_9FIRM|nr:M15 family metallopeptidase [Thermotalea metallivorans]KXG77469.1 hypothetical protein AN619_04540 [Thermotalea metallivorans]
MKKITVSLMFFCVFFLTGCVEKESLQNKASEDSRAAVYDITMKRDLLCLMMAYPEHIDGIERGGDGLVHVVMKSGKRILYDDQKAKGPGEKLGNPDLQDMMEQIYPLSDIKDLMDENFDPGRARVYALFQEVYGRTKEQVQSNLTNVSIGNRRYPFNRNNGASEALQAAMKEITSLAEKQPEIYPFVFPVNGTFHYRVIAGTNQLSPHAFGVAIDLNRNDRDYWKWVPRKEGQKRLDAYPREIVRIFEKHYFIWGGKWGHFDILHFEYRPEIILKAKHFSDQPVLNKPWHNGLENMDDRVKGYIRYIEDVFKNSPST